jgi:tRNA1(Val) A37 N6-methylase TrmN6
MNKPNFELLDENLKIYISKNHTFGSDAILLAKFSSAKQNDTLCDLCTGCGIVAILIHRDFRPKKIYAVDIQSEAIDLLKKSVAENKLPIQTINADLKTDFLKDANGKISLVTCNPPYFKINSGRESTSESDKIARFETMCTIDDICRTSNRLLKYGGRLCLCHRPERISDVINAMKANDIEPKRLDFVCNGNSTSPWLFLIEGKKGGNSGMKINFIQNTNYFTEK